MIIAFPTKPYVRIVSCDVYEMRRVSASGIAVTRNASPVRSYFLELIDEEGRSCVWDGKTYEDALSAANEWAVEGVPVRDHTDNWGRA